MKKGYVLTLLVILLTVQVALAQNQILDQTIDSLSQAIGSIFAPILGVGFGEFLFSKIMLFFLLFAIIFVALNNIDLFEENRPVHVIVTTITSIFAVRYLRPGEFINAILLPYTALGASITSLLPLIIFFYFVHKSGMGPFGRRAAWFTYGLFFIMLWGTREYDSLGTANWVYIIALIFILASLIFDKSIHRYFSEVDYEKAKSYVYDREILKLEEDYARAISLKKYKKAKKIEKQIKKLRRMR
jgi:MFS family permease